MTTHPKIERPAVNWAAAPEWAEAWWYDKGSAYWLAKGSVVDITTFEDLKRDIRRTATVFNDRKEPAPSFGWTGPSRAEPRPVNG